MTQISISRWLGPLELGPGQSKTWFQDDVNKSATRWFTPVPINDLIDDVVMHDQKVAISEVYYILKGKNHTIDGTGGTGTLQVNVTVRNLDADNRVAFEILRTEVWA